MMPKELDCVLLKDGREVVILDDSIKGHYLVETGNVEETEEPPFTVTDDDIERVTFVLTRGAWVEIPLFATTHKEQITNHP